MAAPSAFADYDAPGQCILDLILQGREGEAELALQPSVWTQPPSLPVPATAPVPLETLQRLQIKRLQAENEELRDENRLLKARALGCDDVIIKRENASLSHALQACTVELEALRRRVHDADSKSASEDPVDSVSCGSHSEPECGSVGLGLSVRYKDPSMTLQEFEVELASTKVRLAIAQQESHDYQHALAVTKGELALAKARVEAVEDEMRLCKARAALPSTFATPPSAFATPPRKAPSSPHGLLMPFPTPDRSASKAAPPVNSPAPMGLSGMFGALFSK